MADQDLRYLSTLELGKFYRDDGGNTWIRVYSGFSGGTTLVQEVGQADGVYNYYIDMKRATKFALQFSLDPTPGGDPADVVGFEVFGTIQDDGTAPAACTYQSVNMSLFGVAAFTSPPATLYEDIALADRTNLLRYIRVTVTVAAHDAGAYTILERRVNN